MTTEKFEAFSLEVGDQLLMNGYVFRILEIFDGNETDYLIRLVDEEGGYKALCANSHDLFPVIIDNYSNI